MSLSHQYNVSLVLKQQRSGSVCHQAKPKISDIWYCVGQKTKYILITSRKSRETAVEKSVGRLEETLTGKKRNRKNGGEKLMKQ